MLKKLLAWFRGHAPQSLFTLARARRKSTEKLYVIQVDFRVQGEVLAGIQSALAPIREKYGLDFILLEPGITLRRFDDF